MAKAIIPGVFLLLLGFVIGCSEKDNAPTDVCTDGAVDPLLTGDWLSCNEEWEYATIGYRIHPDGKLEHLGIDWTAGTVALIPGSIARAKIYCADAGFMVQQSWNWDTLRYVITGDRMMWLEEADVVSRRFRRVSIGDVIRNAEQYSFMADINGFPYRAQDVNTRHPAFVRVTEGAGVRRLEFYCVRDTSIIMLISNFTGAGNYPFGGAGRDVSRAAVSIMLSDFDGGGVTTETYTGSVQIQDFDTVQGRCSGTFSFDAKSGMREHVFEVRKGAFDIPIRDGFN